MLTGQGLSISGPGPDFASPGSFVVPASGSYVVRVSAYNGGFLSTATAPYEFFVAVP